MLGRFLSLFGGSGVRSTAAAGANAPIDPAHPDLIAGDDRRDAHSWATAAKYYRAYLKDHPDDFAIWVQLGHALKEDHRMSDADAAYAEARRLKPRDADLLLNYGHLKKLRGEMTEAAALYGASAEIHLGQDVLNELRAPILQPYLTEAHKKLARSGREAR